MPTRTYLRGQRARARGRTRAGELSVFVYRACCCTRTRAASVQAAACIGGRQLVVAVPVTVAAVAVTVPALHMSRAHAHPHARDQPGSHQHVMQRTFTGAGATYPLTVITGIALGLWTRLLLLLLRRLLLLLLLVRQRRGMHVALARVRRLGRRLDDMQRLGTRRVVAAVQVLLHRSWLDGSVLRIVDVLGPVRLEKNTGICAVVLGRLHGQQPRSLHKRSFAQAARRRTVGSMGVYSLYAGSYG